MTTVDRLNDWKQKGIITDPQHQALASLVRKERFSVFLELNALLYLGVLAVAGGLGWTFNTYFTSLGDAFILTSLSAILAASLYYCFSRALPYSRAEVESPNLIFDYVLYLGCLVLSVELGYIEFRFSILRDAWDNYLLLSTAVFFLLAYRFDNRFVLSLGLSSLAGWFGLRVNRFRLESVEWLRISALIYGVVVVYAGTFLYRRGIKKHFLDAYLHVAANIVLLAALSGSNARIFFSPTQSKSEIFYLGLLLALCASSIALGFRFERFAFVLYGTVYGYIGLSAQILSNIHDDVAVLAYIVVTGAIVIVAMAVLARRFARGE
jgi:hypothetical protein